MHTLQVVILCSSILSTEAVLGSLPFLRLKRNTLFVDVLSVKVPGSHPSSGRTPNNMQCTCFTSPVFHNLDLPAPPRCSPSS